MLKSKPTKNRSIDWNDRSFFLGYLKEFPTLSIKQKQTNKQTIKHQIKKLKGYKNIIIFAIFIIRLRNLLWKKKLLNHTIEKDKHYAIKNLKAIQYKEINLKSI